jgi:hypothetical protein
MTMGEPRVPVHLAVILGLSTSAYAIALAAVATLQSAADTDLIAARAPADAAAVVADWEHDRLESHIERAALRFAILAGRYDESTRTVAEVEDDIDALAERTAAIHASAAALPVRISLPSLRMAPLPAAPRPRTHATSGASG